MVSQKIIECIKVNYVYNVPTAFVIRDDYSCTKATHLIGSFLRKS